MASNAPDGLLRTSLRSNSIFSIVSGAALFIADGLFAALLGTLNAVSTISWIGVLLILFGAFVFWLSRQSPIHEGLTRLVIGADVGWVLASWALLAGTSWFTTQGMWTLAIVADIVLVFALLQWFGLRRASSARAATA